MWKPKKKKKYKNKKIYVHYGSDFLNKDMSIEEWDSGDKPKGIWASPKNTNWGWKDWCEYEYFEVHKLKLSFEFKLKRKSRILKIRKIEDIWPYLKEIEDESLWWWPSRYEDYKYELDKKKIYNKFDGMELFMRNNYGYFHNHSHIFTTWDVDSIVIWNLDIIELIKKKAD